MTVWKNPVINITVCVALIVVVSWVLFMIIGATPVWADTQTGDVYEIPEDYESRNYVVQYRNRYYSTDDDVKVTNISDYVYDFTLYYPTNYKVAIRYFELGDSIAMYYLIDDKYLYEKSLTGSADLSFDDNNICCIEVGGKNIYIKKNACTISTSKLSETGITTTLDSLALSTIGKKYLKNLDNFSVNYPFVYVGSNQYPIVFSGIFDNKFVIFQSTDKTNAGYASAVKVCEKYIETNSSGFFPEPTLSSVKKVSDTTLQCFYEFPTQGRIPNFNYVYPKIYVKVSGEDWKEYTEADTTSNSFPHVFYFHQDMENKNIWGALSLYSVYARMGYTWAEMSAEDFEPPKIEGIIWGVQYGYALTQNILDESSIRKSKIVFSRYVFEENIVDTPDVGIGDLGDLPNISGSTSNIEVGTGDSGTSGGSLNRPSGGHDVPDYDSTSFIDMITSGKLTFSAIGDALSGLFSMVSGFASAVGSVLASIFGNAFGWVALSALGAVIVLRVVGR